MQRAIAYQAKRNLVWQTTLVPSGSPVLDVEATGICGTDRHIFEGRIPITATSILGHEIIGRIADLGTSSDLHAGWNLEVGDRVLVAPGISCGHCHNCMRYGMYCTNRFVYGLTPDFDGVTANGGFVSKLVLRPGSRLYRLPDYLPIERAIFSEMMACVVRAFKRVFAGDDIPVSKTVLVMGFGPAGLCAAVLATMAGCRVIVLDKSPFRLAKAKEFGFLTTQSDIDDVKTISKSLMKLVGPVDIAFECVGAPAALLAGIELVRSGGSVIEMGNAAQIGEVRLDPSQVCLRDIRIIGSAETRYEDFDDAIDILTRTPIDVSSAVTHQYQADDLDDPMEPFLQNEVLKALIRFS